MLSQKEAKTLTFLKVSVELFCAAYEAALQLPSAMKQRPSSWFLEKDCDVILEEL